MARALIGTESTCVLVLEAKVRLLPDPPHRALLVVGYADAAAAADHVPGLLQTEGLIGLECFDAGVLDNLAKHGEHIPGMDATARRRRLAAGRVRRAGPGRGERPGGGGAHAGGRRPRPLLFEDEQGQNEVWEVRRSRPSSTPGSRASIGPGRAGRTPPCLPNGWATTCATTARWSTRHGYHTVTVTATSARAACTRGIDFDLQTAAGIENFRRVPGRGGATWSSRYGGSLSGEHGDGQPRAELAAEDVRRRTGPRLRASSRRSGTRTGG